MNEKKKMKIFIGVLVVILLAVVSLAIYESNEQTKRLNKFNEYFNSSSEKLIYFARPTCHYCQLMEDAKKELLIDAKVDYYDVDTDAIDSSILDSMLAKLGITDFGTPTLVIVKEGKVVYTQAGVFSTTTDNKAELKAFLEQYNIIEKSK